MVRFEEESNLGRTKFNVNEKKAKQNTANKNQQSKTPDNFKNKYN